MIGYTLGNFCSLFQECREKTNIYLNHLQIGFITQPSVNLGSSALEAHIKSLIHSDVFVWKNQLSIQVSKGQTRISITEKTKNDKNKTFDSSCFGSYYI